MARRKTRKISRELYTCYILSSYTLYVTRYVLFRRGAPNVGGRSGGAQRLWRGTCEIRDRVRCCGIVCAAARPAILQRAPERASGLCLAAVHGKSRKTAGKGTGTRGAPAAGSRPWASYTTALRAARRAPAHINRHLHWASFAAVETCRPNRFLLRGRRPRRRLLRKRLRSDSWRALRAHCRQLPWLLRPLE